MEKSKTHNDSEKDGIYNGKGTVPIKKDLPSTEFTLKDLEDYLMNIFQNVPKGREIVIGKYCPHQNTIIQLSNNPTICSCQICYGEIIQKGLEGIDLDKL